MPSTSPSHGVRLHVVTGKGGTGTLSVNGQPVATGKIDRTQPFIFSADETADVGLDDGTPVTEDYQERDNRFTGTIQKLRLDLQPAQAAAVDETARKDAAFKKAMAD